MPHRRSGLPHLPRNTLVTVCQVARRARHRRGVKVRQPEGSTESSPFGGDERTGADAHNRARGEATCAPFPITLRRARRNAKRLRSLVLAQTAEESAFNHPSQPRLDGREPVDASLMSSMTSGWSSLDDLLGVERDTVQSPFALLREPHFARSTSTCRHGDRRECEEMSAIAPLGARLTELQVRFVDQPVVDSVPPPSRPTSWWRAINRRCSDTIGMSESSVSGGRFATRRASSPSSKASMGSAISES